MVRSRIPVSGIALDLGDPSPLGATWTGNGVNFAVHSSSAVRIDLCLFDSRGEHEQARLMLPARTGDVWHGFLPLPHGVPGTIYGFRAHGPYEPRRGLRFNPQKLLVDPYARKLAGRFHWHDELFGFRSSAPDVEPDPADSARWNYKAVVTDSHRLGRRSASGNALARHSDLRIARQRIHEATSPGARALSGHLSRARTSVGDRLPQATRHHCR